MEVSRADWYVVRRPHTVGLSEMEAAWIRPPYGQHEITARQLQERE